MPSIDAQDEKERSALYLGWIAEDLLQETILLWSEVYRRPVSHEEALEILANVKRLASLSSHFRDKSSITKPNANPKPDLADKTFSDTMNCRDSQSRRSRQPISGEARRKEMAKR